MGIYDITPEDALRKCVDALRGDKVVGALLWPSKHPMFAGQRLAHCLDPERREKLELGEVVMIFAAARAIGAHEGVELFAKLCGYRITATVNDDEVIADLSRRALAAAGEASSLTTELRARMHAAHINLEAAE